MLLVHRTKARAYYFSTICSLKRHIKTNITISSNLLRPKAEFEGHRVIDTFFVEVGIGNIPTRTRKYIPYFLGFETAAIAYGHNAKVAIKAATASTRFNPFSKWSVHHFPAYPQLPQSCQVHRTILSVSGIAGHETFTFGSEALSGITFETVYRFRTIR